VKSTLDPAEVAEADEQTGWNEGDSDAADDDVEDEEGEESEEDGCSSKEGGRASHYAFGFFRLPELPCQA
jgi:hypothetical protein